ncbi:hypothetical protein QYE76_063194 [Lolium multiflorum]|uniref:Uncharacterized protein n=1 Tax=Lolium multiflorum TaxID=4521 RepID=A0AAD8S4G1_LOLMU|nr:hypothetical protein QYE76_063194 [Lolium multiflorum]
MPLRPTNVTSSVAKTKCALTQQELVDAVPVRQIDRSLPVQRRPSVRDSALPTFLAVLCPPLSVVVDAPPQSSQADVPTNVEVAPADVASSAMRHTFAAMMFLPRCGAGLGPREPRQAT